VDDWLLLVNIFSEYVYYTSTSHIYIFKHRQLSKKQHDSGIPKRNAIMWLKI